MFQKIFVQKFYAFHYNYLDFIKVYDYLQNY